MFHEQYTINNKHHPVTYYGKLRWKYLTFLNKLTYKSNLNQLYLQEGSTLFILPKIFVHCVCWWQWHITFNHILNDPCHLLTCYKYNTTIYQEVLQTVISNIWAGETKKKLILQKSLLIKSFENLSIYNGVNIKILIQNWCSIC